MKSSIARTIVFSCLVLSIVILSFVLLNTSYSVNTSTIEKIEASTNNSKDDDIWEYLDGIEDVNSIGNHKDVVLPEVDVENLEVVVSSEATKKEDPTKALKENEAVKGKSKKVTAAKAAQTYETNETSFGIDVSTWQGKINWKKVKESGVTFAMIRVGFRGMDSGKIVLDNQFKNNMAGALANNINVGVYFFSMAKNAQEAREEAAWVYSMIKDYDITYPVAIDTEIFNRNRLAGVSYSTLTNNALEFSKYIKSKGYTPMIYSYMKALTDYFDTAKFSGQRIWLAQYNDKVTYKGKYHMWQYTSDGSVPGISGRVDMNVAYFSVTNDVTKKSTVNGITNMGDLSPVSFKDMDMLTTLTKKVTLRTSPYTKLPNKAGILDAGTTLIVNGMGDSFIRVIYNNSTYYINDTNCFKMNLDTVYFENANLNARVNEKTELLKQPYTFLNNNSAGNIYANEEIVVTGVNREFTRVLVNGKTYYVYGVDFYDVIKDTSNGSSGSVKEEA